MRKSYKTGYDLADWLTIGLAKVGYHLNDGDAVLDFGCGTGDLVYRFRDSGYDAYGFDIHNYLMLREAGDVRYFRFLNNPIADPSNALFDATSYRIPYDANRFDFVVSTSTLEHVTDMAPVMAEISRVLKPDGVAFHLYPVKSFPIEPHMFVPFAGIIQAKWWFYIWARLGLRNQFQKHLTAHETVESNMRYCRTGLRYWTTDELYAQASPYFDHVEFAKDNLHASAWPIKSNLRNYWRALRGGNMIADLAALPKLHCVLMANKQINSETGNAEENGSLSGNSLSLQRQ